jgi:para-aminobenzoate synthetase/4-amino-4-deoxychorismate lyase
VIPVHGPWGRFDDLRAGTAVRCPPPHRVLVAQRAEDVAEVLAEVQRATDAGEWAFGYVAYEAAAGLDPGAAVHPPEPDEPPLAWFGLCGEPVPVAGLDSADPADAGGGYAADWAPTWTGEEHAADVARIRARIAAGDTYQCNLTVRMRGRFEGDPVALYRDLALGQGGACNAYVDLGRFVVASASPELFFERRGDDVLLRPMKGTARRGRFPAEDRELARRLHASPKDRAENVMIVDLMRNDVAQVADVGTVDVPALFTVERYGTVHQLTSDVTARLRPGVGLLELFRALFPCGSVTGAPKPSSMAIIRDLEPTPRGVYCGAIGLVGPPSAPVRARFSVAIRTVVLDRAKGTAVYGTGGGITWGSDAAAEHAEVLDKAAVLHRRPRAFELLETMPFEPGTGLRNRRRHLDRLVASAGHLGFRLDAAAVEAFLDERLAGSGPARVRLRLRRDGGLSLDVEDPPAPAAAPVTLVVDVEPVDSQDTALFHKTTLREPYERRFARRGAADDAILVNERGEVTETTRATLAVRLDGQWWTPALESGCLPGVERARLLDPGRLRERVLVLADLERAEALAVVSSLRGWRPARLSGPSPRPVLAGASGRSDVRPGLGTADHMHAFPTTRGVT